MTFLDQNGLLVNGMLPYDPEEDTDEMVPISRSEPTTKPREIVCVGAIEIAKPLPPVTFLIEHLGIATGAPVCVAGYGFAGKTIALQSLALSLAAGQKLWGAFPLRKARVLHLDYEQGARLTFERYQRLARGLGIDLAGLEGQLSLGILPAVFLDDKDAADAYARAMDGFDLVILDSLRAAAPGADENSSDVRRHLDRFSRWADTCGAVPLFIHHARKPKSDDSGGAKFALRGSSAVFDACQSVFVMDGAKDKPTRVKHEKCRSRGILIPDFGLRVDDVALDGDPRAGMRVVHLETEELGELTEKPDTALGSIEKMRNHLRDVGEHKGAKDTLRAVLRIGQRQCYSALSSLVASGEVVVDKTSPSPVIRWIGE